MQLTLQPLWRKVSTNREVRCENGDPFPLIMARIGDMITRGAEDIINGVIEDINDVVKSLPWPISLIGPIDTVCFPTEYDPDKCLKGAPTPGQLAQLTKCQDSSYGLEELCYFARVRFEDRPIST